MAGLQCLLVMLLIATVPCNVLSADLLNPDHHCEFGIECPLSIVGGHPLSIIYNETHPKDGAVRIRVSTNNASKAFPILFAIRQQQSILSFQIPVLVLNTYSYLRVNRTLCPLQSLTSNPQITIDVSTMSYDAYNFTLLADSVPMMLQTRNKTEITASPPEPFYLEYHFPKDVQSVVVRAESQDDLCAVLSVQKLQCPVYDLVDNVNFVGYHQTITRSGAITIQSNSSSFGNSFFVVVVVKPNDFDCKLIETLNSDSKLGYNRTKTVNITVIPSVSVSDFVEATLAAFGFFLLFYIIALILTIVYYKRHKTANQHVVVHCTVVEANDSERAGILQDSGDKVKLLQNTTNDGTSSSEISLDENSFDHLHDVAEDRDIIRSKTCLCVADLSKKPRKVLAKKYNLYIWNLITLAIFYVLPVIQLVITYQFVVNQTGDEDICYYNFRCAHRLSFLTSFNNVFSNIGYIMLGILFILLVCRRDRLHRKHLLALDPNADPCGIPQHFGVFYAMGIALVMEGVLSGCYHVCPSYYNFQFDTAFMYMIGWLCMIKIYQTRHPDVNAHAHTAYLVIAFIVFIGVMGVTQGTTTFWIIFTIFYIICFLLLSINVYYVGRWRIAFAAWRDCFLAVQSRHVSCTRPMYMDRMALLVLGNIVNWTYAGYGVSVMPKDFASYLLGIVLINLFMYFTFYIIMKVRCGEKILLQPLFYILAGIAVWGVAFYFFFLRLTSWQVSPAMSRISNEDCFLMNFYDSHDIWHFLSATSLFLGFMLLLTLEDDLIDVPRKNISVF